MKYRFLSAFIAFLTLFTIACRGAEDNLPSEPPEIKNVNAACVYNIENGVYIYEYDADDIVYPASTVKLMTAIVVLEALGDDMAREITITGEALAGVSGNSISLKRGEVLTVEQLLYALICGGANDAANVLAFEVAGSVEAFCSLMNDKAKEIGAVNTHYVNPTGMHSPSMVTTARDTAIIAAYAYSTVPICEMATVEKYTIPATEKAKTRTVFNKNYYFSSSVEYIYRWNVPRGLNAGYTTEGGSCLVTTAANDGLTYIVVCMGGVSDDEYIYSYTEGRKLIEWAFNAYDYAEILTTADMICEIPVKLSGKVDYVGLFPAEDVECYLPAGIDVSTEVRLEWQLDREYFIAPVSEGEVGGSVTVFYKNKNLGTYDLITRNSVSRNNFLYVFDLLSDFAVSSVFNTIITVAVVLLAVYILALIAARIISRQKRNRRR